MFPDGIFFTIFLPMERGMNAQEVTIHVFANSSQMCLNTTLLKLKPHKQHILKSAVTEAHYSTEE